MKTLILSVSLACAAAIPAFAEGAGPGCGGITAPEGAFKFVSPFGDLLLKEDGASGEVSAFVSREALEKTFAGSAGGRLEKYEGRWDQVLSARWHASGGHYSPEIDYWSADLGLLTIIGRNREAAELPGLPVETPFGSGSVPRVVRDLAHGEIFGRTLGYDHIRLKHWQLVQYKDGAAVLTGSPSESESQSVPLGADNGSVKVVTACRMIGETHLLCRAEIAARVAGVATAPRVEYFGFKRARFQEK